jgi:hypothetical protein
MVKFNLQFGEVYRIRLTGLEIRFKSISAGLFFFKVAFS